MKKYILAIAIVLGSVISAMAQSHESKMDEIRSMKIAFMADMMKLTPAESEKFWPMYNEYWNEKVKISHKRRELYQKIENEIATQEQINLLIEYADRESELIKKYGAEFAKAVSVDKAAKAFVAEEKFKSTLLRRAQGQADRQNRK